MDWSKLKEGKCPKCGSKLNPVGLLESEYTCAEPFCTFRISEARFNEIVGSMYKKKAPAYDPDRNLSELNNLEL